MHTFTTRKQRQTLRGWIKWVPVLALPFSVLFFHAFINIQILRADYALRELNAEARELSEQLTHTGIAETIHEDPEVLAARADLMEFVQPDPGQREYIPYDPASLIGHPEDNGFAVAALDAAPHPEAATGEALSTRHASNEPQTIAPTAAPQHDAVAAPVLAIDGAAAPLVSTPVVLEIAPDLESITVPGAAETPVAAPSTTTPATATETAAAPAAEAPVVLDLPDDAFVEVPENLMDADMGSLESL